MDGHYEPKFSAPGADIRTDLPKYKIFENGKFIKELNNINEICMEKEKEGIKLVSFLLGCSFTFEEGLQKSGLSIRHIDENRNVPMYKTSLKTKKSGVFEGPVVVSMRPYKQ